MNYHLKPHRSPLCIEKNLNHHYVEEDYQKSAEYQERIVEIIQNGKTYIYKKITGNHIILLL